MKKKKNNITTFEEHLTERYGTKGTTSRDDFESKAKAFVIGELLKEERILAIHSRIQALIKSLNHCSIEAFFRIFADLKKKVCIWLLQKLRCFQGRLLRS